MKHEKWPIIRLGLTIVVLNNKHRCNVDIFTTQLTRVAPNRIRPEKLKVKSLAKDASSQSIEQEHDHLDGHEENTVTHQHAQKQFHEHHEQSAKEDLQQLPDSNEEDDEDKPHHLDIFV